jgi:hypothetical protein
MSKHGDLGQNAAHGRLPPPTKSAQPLQACFVIRRSYLRPYLRRRKSLVPEDAQQAIGHGVRAKRSKSGAISFDLLHVEEQGHAAV